MTEKTPDQSRPYRLLAAIARGTAVSAAGFILVVAVLMIANFIQVRTVDPLESPAIQTLLKELEADPGSDLLKEQIRSLDLLARKAYFTSKWQLKTGSFLLLSGVVLLLASLKIISGVSARLPEADGLSDKSGIWNEFHRNRRWLLRAGAALVTGSLILAVLTPSGFDQTEAAPSALAGPPSTEEINRNWPNFRGPGGNGHVMVTGAEAPAAWDGAENTGIIWKKEVPLTGMSSPVIWNGKVFLTGADASLRQVYCFDAADGELLWQHDVSGIPGSPPKSKLPDVSDDTGFGASTPATDGRIVCALFATGDLVCLDMNGKRLWAQNLGVPDNHYGHASSLIIHENRLFIQYDQNSNSKCLALDIRTGRTDWEVSRGPISWASPICIDNRGRMELILTNSESADSYDPETGTLYWHVPCLYGEVGPSAAYADGMVYVANEYAVAAAIDVSRHAAEPEIVWEWDEYLPNTSSPLATEKFVILATADGIVNCLDSKTGQVQWEQEFDDGFYSSPILIGDHVYLMDLAGVMHIFKLQSLFEPVGNPVLGESASSTPAFAEGKIYIRGEAHLYCIGT